MIVARTFSTTADTALVNNAVNMAVAYRNQRGATILHADHGTQFTSWSFGENVRRWGLLASFGTVGDCYDNAAMESFWGRLQVELLNTRKWATTLELAAAIADYIDNFYNVERRHSYLGNIRTTEFKMLWTSTYSVLSSRARRWLPADPVSKGNRDRDGRTRAGLRRETPLTRSDRRRNFRPQRTNMPDGVRRTDIQVSWTRRADPSPRLGAQ